MTSFKSLFNFSLINFSKLFYSYKVVLILTILLFYSFNNANIIRQAVIEQNVAVSQWVFPFFCTNDMTFIMYGCLIMFLFLDAPFVDSYSQFIIVRTSKVMFCIGQIIYIAFASLMLTLANFLAFTLSLVDIIKFSKSWESFLSYRYGSYEFVTKLTAIQATLLTFLFVWLVTVFLGLVMYCFNILLGKMNGTIIVGIFIGFAFFSKCLGMVNTNDKLKYISPLNWLNLDEFKFNNYSSNTPVWYALLFLTVLSIVLALIGTITFCSKDLEIK